MGKLDTLTKEYMKRPDIFADVFNQFLYHGKQVIAPDQLVELDTTEITVPYGMDNRPVPEQRYREEVKRSLMTKYEKSEEEVEELMETYWK